MRLAVSAAQDTRSLQLYSLVDLHVLECITWEACGLFGDNQTNEHWGT